MEKYCDVMIIGAGPAGALAALLLAKGGYSVSVFERNSYPVTNKVCGEYLCPAGHKILEELDLGSMLVKYPKIYGMVLHSPDHQRVDTLFPKQEFGHALKRDQFDNELIALAKQYGAVFNFGVSIKEINKNENLCNISDGVHTWSSKILIGADGRQSFVGKWLNLRKKIETKRVAIHAYLNVRPGVKSHKGHMYILADGSYCGLNPVTEDVWNFSLVCDGEKVKHFESLNKVIENAIFNNEGLNEIFDLNKSSKECKIVGKITNPMSRHCVAEKNIALVGDAAGFVDPLTGEGIFHALFTAKALAESLLKEKDITLAMKKYEQEIARNYRKKELVNYFFQWLIKHPKLCNMVARFLNSRPVIRDTFIGLIGNVYTPIEFIKLLIKNIFNKKGSVTYVDHH